MHGSLRQPFAILWILMRRFSVHKWYWKGTASLYGINKPLPAGHGFNIMKRKKTLMDTLTLVSLSPWWTLSDRYNPGEAQSDRLDCIPTAPVGAKKYNSPLKVANKYCWLSFGLSYYEMSYQHRFVTNLASINPLITAAGMASDMRETWGNVRYLWQRLGRG